MVAIAHLTSQGWLFFAAIGVGWASMMGNPYVMLADSVPPQRTGVYMGIFNMFIVLPFIYRSFLGADPRNVLTLAGVLMACGALATLRVHVPRVAPTVALA